MEYKIDYASLSFPEHSKLADLSKRIIIYAYMFL